MEDARQGLICSTIASAAGAKNAKPRKFMFAQEQPEDLATRLKRTFGAKR